MSTPEPAASALPDAPLTSNPQAREPSGWVTRYAGRLRPGARVLDLACGHGRHARYLAGRGCRVNAVDVDAACGRSLTGVAGVEFHCVDLEGGPWPFAGALFDGIVVVQYLHRPLLPLLAAALAPGDFVTGPRDVIRVIADGRRAALSVHCYLSGERLEKRPAYFVPVPEMKIEPNLEKIPRQKMETISLEEQKSLGNEVELGFSKEKAIREAQRCLQCHIFTIFDRSKCILCGGCVDICPKFCFRMARLGEIQGDEKLARSVRSLYGVTMEEAERLNLATAMIKDESRCIQCGLCAKRCPTGAITMEKYHRESTLFRQEGRG